MLNIISILEKGTIMIFYFASPHWFCIKKGETEEGTIGKILPTPLGVGEKSDMCWPDTKALNWKQNNALCEKTRPFFDVVLRGIDREGAESLGVERARNTTYTDKAERLPYIFPVQKPWVQLKIHKLKTLCPDVQIVRGKHAETIPVLGSSCGLLTRLD